PSGTYSYVVTGTDGNGCVSTGSSHVLVYSLPVVTVTSGTICSGQQTATLTASGASAYSWIPSNTLSNSTGASVFGFPATIGENDYTVTATDIHSCVNTATTSIWVNSLPTVTIHTVTPECVPFCPTLTATPTLGSGPYSYSWSFGTGQTSLLANPTPCYSVAGVFAANLLITDANGCTTTASTPVNALSIPTADFDYGQQPVSILSPEVQFTNQSTYGLPIHNWFFGDVNNTSSSDTSSVNNPTHTYLEVGTYNVTLTVSTLNGCSATVTKPVIINEDYALYVPNAFSPNGDGKNEFFKAEGEGVKDYKLFVFDRWGLLLFYSDDINKGWDGKIQGSGDLVQEDVYVWKIQTTDFTNKSKNLHGTVTLL
ncbi:MAG TPA: PKD domain-containing protein, partial [Bacteroidia bacterium]|nr:PKD domain-containing protein [Bacteroidia bacterium]